MTKDVDYIIRFRHAAFSASHIAACEAVASKTAFLVVVTLKCGKVANVSFKTKRDMQNGFDQLLNAWARFVTDFPCIDWPKAPPSRAS